jgi:uncharacterized protein (TIGR00725 family)
MTTLTRNLATEGKPSRDQAPQVAGMRLKIGVMGSASTDLSVEYLQKAVRLGEAIARAGCVVLTGACPGLPLAAADAARRAGGFVIGISPALTLKEHIQRYASPADGHDVIVYTGAGLMGREIINIRSSDIVVIVGGRAGTLGEFAIAYEEGKLIGVVKGTGGITPLIPTIVDACKKETGAEVLYDDDPSVLVNALIARFISGGYKPPSCFQSTPTSAGVRTVRDAVCGMWLDSSSAPEFRTLAGRKFYFCCPACASTFEANPDSFTSAQAAKG